MTPSRFRWGLLLITIGVMLLLNNAGTLSWDYWPELLLWWPLILIAIGIEKIFLKTGMQFISYLAPLMLVFAMIYIAIDVGSQDRTHDFFSSYRWDEAADPNIKMTDAVIEHGRTNLFINSGGDLVAARFNRFSRKPEVTFNKADGTAKLELKGGSRVAGSLIVFNRQHSGRDWNISFSEETPLRLECRGNNSDLSLNMESVPVENLKIIDREGDIYIKIGNLRPKVDVNVEGSEAQLRLRVPNESGLKVAGSDYTVYLKALGLVEQNGFFMTNGFDTSKVQISLSVDKGLQHLSIDRY